MKKVSCFLATMALVVMMAMPVDASTTELDVQAGDINSYYTYKDTGANWENLYYVTATTYVGYPVMGCSVSQSGKYSSGFTEMENKAKSYTYSPITAPGGIYYRLVTGPSVLSGSNWHLTGRYTP